MRGMVLLYDVPSGQIHRDRKSRVVPDCWEGAGGIMAHQVPLSAGQDEGSPWGRWWSQDSENLLPATDCPLSMLKMAPLSCMSYYNYKLVPIA